MSFVTVLMPNGHRQNVKITPDTTLLQVLEEVCSKHGYKPEEYDIRHHNKIMDVSSIFRFSDLPNNALLEMTEVKKYRSETKVVLGLHLESGERPTGEFTPLDSLWHIIMTLNPEAKSMSNPVIIYMRKEVHGREKLEETTLRNLGLTGGRAVVRLFDRKPEELHTQANVSSVLTRPAEPERKYVVARELERRWDEDEAPLPPPPPPPPPPRSRSRSHSRDKSVKGEKEDKHKSSPSPAKKFPEKPKETGKGIESPDDKKAADVAAKDRDSSEKDKDEKGDDENVPQEKATTESTGKSLPEEPEEDEGRVILLGERNAVAYSLNSVKPIVFEEEPDEFFELTISDAKLLMRDAKQLSSELQNTPLMTSAQRELNKNKKILSMLNQYKKTVLRIKFPDRTVLQGTFSSVEKVSAVEKFVSEYLEDPSMPFYLYTSPPKEILKSESNLLEVNCVPSANVYFGVGSEIEPPKQFLRSDVMERFSSPRAAAMTALKSRGLPTKAREDKDSEGESDAAAKDDFAPVPGPSTSASSSVGKPRAEQETSPPFKVPKWFKMQK